MVSPPENVILNLVCDSVEVNGINLRWAVFVWSDGAIADQSIVCLWNCFCKATQKALYQGACNLQASLQRALQEGLGKAILKMGSPFSHLRPVSLPSMEAY